VAKFNGAFAGLVMIVLGSAVSVSANPFVPTSSIWAAQSLAYLMERYPCTVHSAHPTPLKTQPNNRYETAALLSSCLAQWGDLPLDPQAQTMLNTLRSEFKLELAALQSDQPSAQLSRLVVLGSKNLRSKELFNTADPQNWTAGVGIRDFIIPKSLLTFTAGQAATVINHKESTQMNYGAFYQFPIGDRLTLSPSVVIMTNPSSPSATPAVQGALQASFSF
jgi:hypothetical protein